MNRNSLSFIISYLLIISFFQSRGQSPSEIDSLKKIINFEKSVDLKIQYINKLARIYIDQSDSLNAITLLNQALVLCQKATSSVPKSYTHSNLGIFYIRRSEFEKADSLFELAFKYSGKENTDKGKMESAVVLGEISTTFSRKGDYQKAIDYKLKAIEIIAEINADDALKARAVLYGGIAGLYADQKQYDTMNSWLRIDPVFDDIQR